MKPLHIVSLAAIALSCSSCLTSLLTMAALSDAPQAVVATPVYTTAPTKTVYVAQPQPVTTIKMPAKKATTISVTTTTPDISLYLDLQAVAAAFGQANTSEEFEMLLNSSQYMLNNLDLNGDGYVDYLRVLETINGYNHVFVIQAVLAANVYQDVATIVAEMGTTPYVQIIGHQYVYGTRYIIEPVFVKIPPIYAHLRGPRYVHWRSPYYWNHFPSHYKKPAPLYLSHYQAYVRTYMHNHKYCNEVRYSNTIHYSTYQDVCRQDMHNDYGQQHPQTSFAQRNTGKTNASEVSDVVRSATTVKAGANTRTAATNPDGSTPVRGATTSATPASAAPASSSTATRAATTSTSSATRTPATSTASSSTATRSSSSTATRTSATTTATPSNVSTSSSATRVSTTSSSSASRTPSTTVTSRVNQSGVTNTSTRTVNSNGTTTTTTRSTNTTTTRPSSSSSTRSSATSSSSRSAASSSSSSSRSSSTSTSTRSSSTSTSSRSASSSTSTRR